MFAAIPLLSLHIFLLLLQNLVIFSLHKSSHQKLHSIPIEFLKIDNSTQRHRLRKLTMITTKLSSSDQEKPDDDDDTAVANKPLYTKQPHRTLSPFSLYSPKLSIYLLATCVLLFILFHIQTLQTPPPSLSTSWPFIHTLITNSTTTTTTTETTTYPSCPQHQLESITDKLRDSVTFLPLKDLRFAHEAQQGHTWFMSSMYDTQEEGEVQYQKFPSTSSKGRILCIQGRDRHDGSWNYYALAWPDALPRNATLMNGTTFVSYNHYNYDNIWHGLSAMVPFVAWHIKCGCVMPSRWILYHWGELRTKMGDWLSNLMEATFSGPLEIMNGVEEGGTVCFEEAVVMRHNEGGMSRVRRTEVYDVMRCKARETCKVVRQEAQGNDIGLTLFMRTGPRSFKNESEVVRIFENECKLVQGCRLMVAYSNNLTFCQQVKLMSETDILVSPHGAQLTNMFFMDKNSSVMEFFPKGWLKLAGVGQYVFHWIANWSGMKHEGAWRDPDGDHCPYPDDDRRCMSIYKSGKIGYNETYFSEWAKNVLNQVKMRKVEEASKKNTATNAITTSFCACN